MTKKTLCGVILDPQPLWLEALSATLSRLGVEVVHQTTEARDAVHAILAREPDLFVAAVDFEDGEREALGCISEVLAVQPSLKVVATSRSGDAAAIESARVAGVSAFVMRSVQPDDFAAVVRSIFEPGMHYSDEWHPPERATGAPEAPPAEAGEDLTKREREILLLAAEGLSNIEIAKSLWVTEQTVKFHLSNTYRKLGVRNRTQASMWAWAQARALLPSREQSRAPGAILLQSPAHGAGYA